MKSHSFSFMRPFLLSSFINMTRRLKTIVSVLTCCRFDIVSTTESGGVSSLILVSSFCIRGDIGDSSLISSLLHLALEFILFFGSGSSLVSVHTGLLRRSFTVMALAGLIRHVAGVSARLPLLFNLGLGMYGSLTYGKNTDQKQPLSYSCL